jgi:hypothetical protein
LFLLQQELGEAEITTLDGRKSILLWSHVLDREKSKTIIKPLEVVAKGLVFLFSNSI